MVTRSKNRTFNKKILTIKIIKILILKLRAPYAETLPRKECALMAIDANLLMDLPSLNAIQIIKCHTKLDHAMHLLGKVIAPMDLDAILYTLMRMRSNKFRII